MKSLNAMNCINDQKANNTSEWNLPHGILNNFKCTKNINSNYFPIIHGCMDTCRGKEKFNILNFIGYWM